MTSALHPAVSAAAAPVRQHALNAATSCARKAEHFETLHAAFSGCLCAVQRAKADAYRCAALHWRRLVRAHLHVATDLTDYRAPSDTNHTLAENLARLAASCA